MLRRFPTARFAYNVPPEKERRLLHVWGQNGPGEPGNAEGNVENRAGGGEAISPIEIIKNESHTQLDALTGAETNEQISTMLRSDDAARIVDESVLLRQKVQEQIGNMPMSDLLPEERERILRELTGKNRNASLLLAQLFQQRTERYEELLRLIENKTALIFGGIKGKELLNQETIDQLEVLQGALTKIPSDTLGQLLTMRTQHEDLSIDRSMIASTLALDTYLSAKEQEDVLPFLVNLEATVHKKRKLGLSADTLNDPVNLEDKIWQSPYLNALYQESFAARKLLANQLRTDASELLRKNQQRRAEVIAELHLGPSMSEEEATRRSLARFGIGYDALLQAFFDADIPALEVLGKLDHGALPFAEEEEFLQDAQKVMDMMRDASTGDSIDDFLAEARSKQRDAERWWAATKKHIQFVLDLSPAEREKIQPLFGDDLWKVLQEISSTDLFLYTDLSEDKRQTLTAVLQSIRYGREEIREGLPQEIAAEETWEQPADAAIQERCEAVRTKMRSLLGTLLSDDAQSGLLAHPIAQTLPIRKMLNAAETYITAYTGRAVREQSPEMLRQAEAKFRQLQRCLDVVEKIAFNVVETDDEVLLPLTEKSAFLPDKQKIIVRKGLPPEEREKWLQHEMGHAILFAIRMSGLSPFLLAPLRTRLQERAADGRSIYEMLEPYAVPWGIQKDYDTLALPKIGKVEADKWKQQELVEELIMRHANWTSKNRPLLKDDTLAKLFSLLEETDFQSHEEETVDIGALIGSRRRMTAEEEEEEQIEHAEESAETTAMTSEVVEPSNYKQDLVDISRNIATMKNFHAAYRHNASIDAELTPVIKQFSTSLHTLEAAFMGELPEKYGEEPEQNPQFRDDIQKILKQSESIVDRIRDFDVQRLDITQEQKRQETGFFSGIQWVSILDLQKLWSDTMEDFKTMYGRGQQRRLQVVGNAIFETLDKGKDIPGIGSYLGRIKGYHTRRYSGAELESVNKWKEGLENEDSHTLLHMFPGTSNKDQIRAMITLLTDRGEMEWNDRGVMKKLGELSGYPVPIDACLRDDVLRDTWYRRMVTEIWADSELYYQWRGTNDDKVESGKKHFTTFVDQLSNVRSGMQSELAKQLRLFTAWKAAGEQGAPPEDVKPHLYEEVIHYAIRNGKMTMEAKFYYLVRGVASGLLSIDRLRALAGERGGILNQFPFIDYFYQKNNSVPEIEALAERLIEKKKGKDTYTPGVRTTLWLHLEVSREKSVQDRLSKGTSRTGAEEIDHEDIPFFITQLDYNNGVRNLADIISGSRQKVTPEGWKNAYVGFSSKFKIFGRVAQLDAQKKEKFTVADARNLAQTVAAYIDMDNILMRNGTDKDSRPTLSEYQLDSLPPSGDGDHTAKQYRERVNEFIGALIQRYGREIENSKAWKEYNDDLGKQTQPSTPLSITEFAPTDGTISRVKGKKRRGEVAEATPIFVKALETAILKDMDGFKEILGRFAGELHDEGGSKDQLELQNIIEAVADRRSASRQDVPAKLHLHGHEGQVGGPTGRGHELN